MLEIFASLALAFSVAGAGCAGAPSLMLDGRALVSERAALRCTVVCFTLAALAEAAAFVEIFGTP